MAGPAGDDDGGTDTTTICTVAESGRATVSVRGSDFIGHVTPAESVAVAEAFIDEITAEHADATHNVPAYRVRDGDLLREWSSDADEPSGSAGKPALNVLVQRELENVAVVVARYFGGTELGVGGLARAYGRAVSEAVDDASVVERPPLRELLIEVDYDDSGVVRGLLESSGATVDASYEETVRFEVQVPVGDAEGLLDRVRSATSGRAKVDHES